MLLGAGIALLTSLAWAVSSIVLKFLTDKIDPLSINTIRMWTGSVILLTLVLVTGRTGAFAGIAPQPLMYVIASGILAMAIGDTIYIRSLAMLDASVAFPISQCAFVVMAGTASILWLDEPYTWLTVAGAILVMGGIYLIASDQGGKTTPSHRKSASRTGVIVTLLASVIWTAATITLKIGSRGIDPIVVAAIRISVSAVVLTALATAKRNKGALQLRKYGSRSLLLMATAGILTYGIAAVGYVSALQMIGAGKTVLLTTSAPLFALPFSILLLKERPTRAAIVGIIASVAGVCLVVV